MSEKREAWTIWARIYDVRCRRGVWTWAVYSNDELWREGGASSEAMARRMVAESIVQWFAEGK